MIAMAAPVAGRSGQKLRTNQLGKESEGDQTAKVCYEKTIRLSVFDCSQATAYANLIGLKHLAGGNARSKAPG